MAKTVLAAARRFLTAGCIVASGAFGALPHGSLASNPVQATTSSVSQDVQGQHGWWIVDLERDGWHLWDGPYAYQVFCAEAIQEQDQWQYPHRVFQCERRQVPCALRAD